MASAIVAAGCASMNAGAASLGNRLNAAIDEYCVPFVSSGGEQSLPTSAGPFPVTPIESLPSEHPAHRVPRGWASAIVGEADADGFVTVGSSNDDELGPLCTAIAHGPGANSAVLTRAENMQLRRSEWTLDEHAPGRETLTFFERRPHRREWVTELLLDPRDSSESNLGGGMALLSRVPVWNEADHPEEPTLAELDAAERMSIEEALLAATFEIGIPLVRAPNSNDPILLRRTRVLGQGIVDTFIMRMSNDESQVGIVSVPYGEALTVVARGPRAGRALEGIRRRLRRDDWRSEPTSDRARACYLSSDSVIEVCLPDSQQPDRARIVLRRVLPLQQHE